MTQLMMLCQKAKTLGTVKIETFNFSLPYLYYSSQLHYKAY